MLTPVLMLLYRKDTEHAHDTVRDLSGRAKSPLDAAVRPSRSLSPVLRPDSTVTSEERGVPVSEARERAQRRSSPGSDCVAAGPPSQRPPVWNPFLVDVTAAAAVAGESLDPPADAETKVGAATKHPRSSDDETHSAAKRRKTTADVQGGGDGGEREPSDGGRRPSGQSPSSSTPDAGATDEGGGSASAAGTQDITTGSCGVCAPDSSCDQQSSTQSDDVKQLSESVTAGKDTHHRSSVQKDFTAVGVQETGSLLPLATQ